MTALWSAEQQAWLKALGHRVFMLAGDEPGADALVGESLADARAAVLPPRDDGRQVVREHRLEASAPAPDKVRARPPLEPADGRAESRRGLPAGVATASPQPAAPSRVPDDALERALLRATGQRTRSEARAVLERLGMDLQTLRGNPAAKRALWLKLRPLRPRFRP